MNYTEVMCTKCGGYFQIKHDMEVWDRVMKKYRKFLRALNHEEFMAWKKHREYLRERRMK